MSSVVISGDASGQVTLAAPAVAGTTTLTLQSTTGTVALQGDVIGLGQTWQTFSVGSTRVNGTTYTNTTGKPIQILILGNPISAANPCNITVSGTVISSANNGNSGGVNAPSAPIVPPGATYSATGATSWSELR